MALEKEIFKSAKGKETEHYVALFDEEDSDSVGKNMKKHFKMFKTKKTEQEVLDYYENLPDRIKNYEGNRLRIIKANNLYYMKHGGFDLINKDYTKMISVSFLEGFSKEWLIKYAISSLKHIVKEKNISLSDKKIIKDLAISALNENLNLGLNSKQLNFSKLIYCVRVDLREDIRHKLASYGFTLKKEVIGTMLDMDTGRRQKVKFIDLTQEDSENYFARNTNL